MSTIDNLLTVFQKTTTKYSGIAHHQMAFLHSCL